MKNHNIPILLFIFEDLEPLIPDIKLIRRGDLGVDLRRLENFPNRTAGIGFNPETYETYREH